VENHGWPAEIGVDRRPPRPDRAEATDPFQPNRAVILSDSYDVLRQVAQAVKDAEGVPVRIEAIPTTSASGRKTSSCPSSAPTR